jgi:CRP-like cAMP-binding protein
VRNERLAAVSIAQAQAVARGRARLAACGWLAMTDPAFTDAALSVCRWRLLGDGELLSHPQLEEETMFGIAEGHVVGERHPLGSVDFGLSAVWHVGSWVGFAPLISGAERRGTIRARGDALVAVMAGPVMHRLLAAQPAWWREMAKLPYLVSQIHAGAGQDLLRRDAGDRCLAVLLLLAGCRWADPETARPFVAPVSQQELGERCNLSRNGVIKALRPLADAGLITLGYRRIEVHDARALRARLTLHE